MKKERQKVKIEKLDHQGRGIAKQDKIIFIPYTLKDEEVIIEITKEKKNFKEAKPIEWKTKSKDRIESICPYFMQCGGCDLQHLNYQKQLEYKQNKIKEILLKFANYEGKINPIIKSENNLNYRNKLTLHVINGKINLLKKETNQGINISYCYLVNNKINEIIKVLETLNLNNINSITIKISEYTNDAMIIFETERNNLEITNLKPLVTSIILKNNQNYKTIYGNNTIIEKLNNLSFHISPESFFQVNTKQAEKLYELVKDLGKITKEDTVLDLYCGTGTIGLYISKYAKEVIGIEINKYAVENAIENQKLNNIHNITFHCGDVGKILSKNNFSKDIIIVDPPRAGLNEQAKKEILKIKPKKIIYVSCDPVTLARDIKDLNQSYELKEVTPVDMFPNTMHIETIVLLQKK